MTKRSTQGRTATAAAALAAAGRERGFRMTMTGRSATVYIFGRIGGYSFFGDGVNASEFAAELDGLDVDEINLRINSTGGDAFEGITIMNTIRRHSAKTIAHVDGLAASAASIIAMGADEVVMHPGSEMMIHDASMCACGDAGWMREVADLLDKLSDDIAKLYAKKAGAGSAAAWREVMVAETWYTGEEAVAAGLADRVDDADDAQNVAAAVAEWDLSMFAHAGRADAPAPPIAAMAKRGPKSSAASAAGSNPPAAKASGDTTQEEVAAMFTDAQMTSLRQSVGVAADADADTILGALAESLEERASDAPAASIPEGTVLIDQGILTDLQRDAKAGADARAQQESDRRTSVVNKAITSGRVSAASREHWLKALANDTTDTTEKLLASMAPNTIPVDEIGHGTPGPHSADPSNQLYDTVFGDPAGAEKED